MFNSKLLDIIEKFDKNKFNQFSDFLQMYRRKKELSTIKLFDIIYSVYPNFSAKLLSKEEVHRVIFPSKQFDEKRVQNVMSDLLTLTEKFIALDAAQKEELKQGVYLLEFYLEHNLNKHFESTYRKLKEQIANSAEDSKLISLNYQIEELYIMYQLKYNIRYSNYQPLYNALNDWRYSQEYKLKNLCLINLHNEIDSSIINSKLANMHRSIHELLISPNNPAYIQFKTTLFTELKTLVSKSELRTIVILSIDYVIKQINNGNTDFYSEVLDLYNFMIEEHIILESNQTISAATLKNYITISIRLGLLEKANSFLEEFKNYIQEEDFEDVYNFNKATIYFQQQKYEETLHLLISIKYKDIFYKVNAKRLYLKIYYELNAKNTKKYFDVLESALNAFKKYIYTSKELPQDFKERNIQFYKYLTKIIQYKQINKPKLQQLKQDLLQDKLCIDKDWLLNKID